MVSYWASRGRAYRFGAILVFLEMRQSLILDLEVLGTLLLQLLDVVQRLGVPSRQLK